MAVPTSPVQDTPGKAVLQSPGGVSCCSACEAQEAIRNILRGAGRDASEKVCDGLLPVGRPFQAVEPPTSRVQDTPGKAVLQSPGATRVSTDFFGLFFAMCSPTADVSLSSFSSISVD
jgi:hypothetical protein